MIENIGIKVEVQRPLSSYGKGYLIMHNENTGLYCVVSRAELLGEQNAKIKALENKVTQMEKTMNAFIEEVKKSQYDFNEQYKQSNATLIDMVKTLVEKGE